MDMTITDRALALRNLLMLTDPAEIQVELQRIETQTARYADAQRILSKMFATEPSTEPAERALLERVGEQADLAAPLMAKASALGLAKKTDEACLVLRTQFRPVQRKWWELPRELNVFEEKQSEHAAVDAARAHTDARALMLGFGSLALLISVAAALMITRGLVRQLGGEPDYAVALAADPHGPGRKASTAKEKTTEWEEF